MRKFETKIEYLKYQVLLEVAKHAWNEDLVENVLDIPKKIIPGNKPSMRCCVYKERAIIAERVKLAMGGDRKKKSIIEVINIACDECPIGGYEVTDNCRGCLAQRCVDVCPKKAITFDNRYQAHIDKSICINCGSCAKACQYQAIINRKKPCENACICKAIETTEEQVTKINEDKCINCGACTTQCPFGAIMDKSFILDAINYIIKAKSNDYKVYAMIAPSIVDSFNANFYQIVTALKMLGFDEVYEIASGADMTALNEVKELDEKKFLLSSCCPAFVNYVNNNYPTLKDSISCTPSPMAILGKALKELDPNCKTVFIGPCTAKKAERNLNSVKHYVDVVLTYDELVALLDSKNIDETTLEETHIDNGTYFARMFAKSGGVAAAIEQGLKEINSDLNVNIEVCSGIEECKIALTKKQNNLLQANFIEGMACTGGCVNGAGTNLKYYKSNKHQEYANESNCKTIIESVDNFKK